jgi:histidinol dehydrogenase
VLNRIDLRGCSDDPRGLLPRAAIDVDAAIDAVRPVVKAVRERGVPAIREACRRFDGFEPSLLRVPVDEIHHATAALDPAVAAALTESIARARRVHTAQRPESAVMTLAPGATVTQRWSPVGRVGLYVPGGLAVYPSSVVMNVVPAQVAGVSSLAVASPPRKDTGLPHPLVLAACGLLGVDEVYGVGGAQAIAMFGYGVIDADPFQSCRPVDLVTGPGNIWVTAAKRLLRGVVGIDAEAGPTEVMILADETADARNVAADLISQAEHDPLAASVLVTDSVELVDAVDAELTRQVAAARHSARITTALTGQQSAAVLVDDLDAGVRAANAYAAEHLEIQTREAGKVADRITNAGAIFVGTWSPVSLGDYCAGSNHVLPTAGCARHSSGLSVQTFLKGVQVIEYDAPALREVADHVVALATAEDLPAHGRAVRMRQEP